MSQRSSHDGFERELMAAAGRGVLEAAKQPVSERVAVYDVAALRMCKHTTAAAMLVQASIEVAERS